MSKPPVKLTKEDIKGPDLFISTADKAWTAIEKNKVLVLTILGVFLIGATGWSGMVWWNSKKESKAQEAYYSAKKVLIDTAKLYEVPEATPEQLEKKETPVAKKTKSGDFEADFGAAAKGLEDMINSHKGSHAAAAAALDLAPVYDEYKLFDRGAKTFTTAAQSLSGSDLFAGLVHLQLGNYQQALGQCDAAIKTWQKVSSNKDFSFLHADALLKEGLCWNQLGDNAKATELFKKLAQDFADTDAGRSAKKYLRLLNANT